ncbi:MAG TPA: hypothetical protein VFG53_16060 [Anaeromyxobacter sp.]|nr:hypothetical protein [Anaeromyxobacter sp.]
MTGTRHCTAVLVLAALAYLGTGCGSNNDCTITPDLATPNPQTCTLPPQMTVTVNVRWCNCGAATVCKVTDEGQGIFQLEPQVNSCDASCPANPAGCPSDFVQCIFQSPNVAGDYQLYLISGESFKSVPMTIVSGVSSSCG